MVEKKEKRYTYIGQLVIFATTESPKDKKLRDVVEGSVGHYIGTVKAPNYYAARRGFKRIIDPILVEHGVNPDLYRTIREDGTHVHYSYQVQTRKTALRELADRRDPIDHQELGVHEVTYDPHDHMGWDLIVREVTPV